MTSPETDLEIAGLRIQPGDRIGPYVYRRLAGKGGMAHVVVATDPDGASVALKILKSGRIGTGLARFKREFRALARLRHPNVIRVEAYGDIFGHPYIAMEFVDGDDLHTAIHNFRTVPNEERWRRCESILVDLCRALAYIHRRGLIHRDLKPSNILIDRDGRCKLTDFGIVKDLDPALDTALSTTLVGTWAYASPEQIMGQPIDHRSDLYSLGVMLYAMLTGRRPFVARDLAGYVELHRTHQASPPRDVDPGVPAHLDEICARLLRKNPRERFRSAQEILYRLEQMDVDADSSEIATWAPPLVGREAEEELLRERVAGLTRGEGGILVFEGGEGTGKSRLLDLVVDEAAAIGLTVLRDHPTAGEPPMASVWRLANAMAAELDHRAPNELRSAIQAFEAPDRGPVNARDALEAALRLGLDTLREEGPVVVVVDDLHLASASVVSALDALAPRAPGDSELRPVLFVYAWRADRALGRLRPLRTHPDTVVVPVLPLTQDAVSALVTRIVGPVRAGAALGLRLFRETEGNVLFLVLFLQNLMLHGMLARTAGGWRLIADADEIASGHFDVPPGVRQVVRARLAPIAARERRLVEVVATHGREMDLDALLDVLEVDEDAASADIEALVTHGILRERSSGARQVVVFAQAKFGDVLYRELDPERRAQLHLRLAAVIEARGANAPGVAEIVGEHYRRGGDAGRAYVYLGRAARRLVDRGMPADAAEIVARASQVEDPARVDLGPAAFAASRHALLLVRAEAAFIRGELAESKDALDQALGLLAQGVSERDALRTRILCGRTLRAIGEFDAAELEVEAALPRARALHDRELVAEGLVVLAAVAWSRGALDACETRAQEGLLLATGGQLGGVRAQLLIALTAVQASRGQLASAAGGLAEAQLLFRDLHIRPSRALALSNLAEVLLAQGDVAGAWSASGEALAEAAATGHRIGECAAWTIRGCCAAAAGAADDARAACHEAIDRARQLGLPGEALIAHLVLGRLAVEAANPDEALLHLDHADAAARSADPERYTPMIEALRAQAHARASMGALDEVAVDFAIRQARAARERSARELGALPLLRRAQVTLDLARASALSGELDAAATLARAAAHLSSMRGFRLITLEALSVGAMASDDPRERERLAGEARDYVAEVLLAVPAGWRRAFEARVRDA